MSRPAVRERLQRLEESRHRQLAHWRLERARALGFPILRLRARAGPRPDQ